MDCATAISGSSNVDKFVPIQTPQTKNPASHSTRPGVWVGPSLAAFVKRPQAGANWRWEQYSKRAPMHQKINPLADRPFLAHFLLSFGAFAVRIAFLHRLMAFSQRGFT